LTAAPVILVLEGDDSDDADSELPDEAPKSPDESPEEDELDETEDDDPSELPEEDELDELELLLPPPLLPPPPPPPPPPEEPEPADSVVFEKFIIPLEFWLELASVQVIFQK